MRRQLAHAIQRGLLFHADTPATAARQLRLLTPVLLRLLLLRLAIASETVPDRPQPDSAEELFDGWLRLEERIPGLPLSVQPAREGSQGTLSSRSYADVRTLVDGIVIEQMSPYDVLSCVYESLLRLWPDASGDGRGSTSASARRARYGAFYTPPAVARAVVDATLAALPPHDCRARIFDPTMGLGVFLLEATRSMAASGEAASVVAEECVYGTEIDPLAVELAIAALWLETGARPARVRRHLQHADGLTMQSQRERYDAVVGNPPWGILATYGHGPRRDSFKAFAALSIRLSTHAVGLVLPRALLQQDTHADTRAALLERMDPYLVAPLPPSVFPDAAAPSCAIVFGPRPGPPQVVTALHDGEVRPRGIAATGISAAGFRLTDERAQLLLKRLQADHPSLEHLKAYYRVRDVGINYNRAAVADEVLYMSDTPDDPRDIGRYRGRDFHRYTSIAPGGWIRHDWAMRLRPGDTLSLNSEVRCLPEKIVLRQTSDRIIATIDRTQMAMGRSVIAITCAPGISLLPLLACLNSRVTELLYGVLAGEAGRILPQVKVGRLLALPIPEASLEPGNACWLHLAELACALLACGGNHPDLRGEIDNVVARAFRLTVGDVELMAGSILP